MDEGGKRLGWDKIRAGVREGRGKKRGREDEGEVIDEGSPSTLTPSASGINDMARIVYHQLVLFLFSAICSAALPSPPPPLLVPPL
jgi:hypothetical protein